MQQARQLMLPQRKQRWQARCCLMVQHPWLSMALGVRLGTCPEASLHQMRMWSTTA
jgi:hypothetical protein